MSHSSSQHHTRNIGPRLGYSLLSALVPGTGQIVAGYWRRGAIMLTVTLLLVIGGLYIYSQGTSTLLSWAVQPRILIAVFIVNALVLLFRAAAIIDAYLTPRSGKESGTRGWQAGLAVVVLVVMLAVTAAPHVIVGYYTYLAHETLTTVFSTESLADSIPTPTPAPTEVPGAEPTATPEPTATSTPEPDPNETSSQVTGPVTRLTMR